MLPPHTTHLTQPLDKCAFSTLKVHWKQVCHVFLVKNPGRVVTRCDFNLLFSEAWSKAMTMRNVMAGFKTTGIYPFNRNAIKLPASEEYKLFRRQEVPNENGIAYLPLYSPVGRLKIRASTTCSVTSEDSADQCIILQLKNAHTLSHFLQTPLPPFKIPTVHGKSSGKVLTCKENIEIMEAKKRGKDEILRLKEERKHLREERKKAKEAQKNLKSY